MENISNDNEWNILNLNDDESDHIRKVSGEIANHLALAENAAVITVNGIMSLKEYPRIDEPEGIVSLLLVKSSKNVRFAVKGLRLGYYSGSSAALRSAFEDLAYAVLFHTEPSQVAKWFRNEFSKAPFEELNKFREEQKKDAKRALFSQETSPIIIKDALSEYVNKANMRIHPTITGLAEEFGIDLEYFISREMEEALSESEGDITKALDRYVLKTSFRDYVPREKSPGGEVTDQLFYIELPGRYDESTLSDLALFAFYIAHRLLDFTKIIFNIEGKDFFDQYKDWHKAIKDLGWSAGHE